MKKIIATAAVTAIIGIFGIQIASAGWGGGYGPGACWTGNGVNTGVSGEAVEARKTFFTETVELRKAIALKRIDLATLLHSETSDPAQVDTVRAELNDLLEELRNKGEEAGMGAGRGFGPGYHMGEGYGMMGYGMGPDMMWGGPATTETPAAK